MWSAVPDGRPPLVGDLAVEAESATGVRDVVETLDGYDGEATVVTYTVTFEGMDPVRTVALCDTGDGRRCVALAEDADVAVEAVETELIGRRVGLAGGSLSLL